MTCAELRDCLQDLIDDHLDPSARRAAEAHVMACRACRIEADGMRRLLAAARALPISVEPPADLWPAIAPRLESRGPVRRRELPLRLLALAASVALALLIAGVTRGPGRTTPSPTIDPRVATPVKVQAMLASNPRYGEAEAALLHAKQQLQQALAERRSEMSPQTAAVVDRNLALIEGAIDEIRLALEEDPGDPTLNRMLLAAHQRELELLQRVTRRARPL